MRIRSRKRSGFTLIEMLIVVALLGVLSLVIIDLLIGQYRLYHIEFSELIVQSETRATLDGIDNDVRSATQVLETFDVYTTGSDCLILAVQSLNSAGQLIPGTFDYVIVRRNGNALIRELIPDSASVRPTQTKQLAANVTNLVFTYNSPNVPEISEVLTQITVVDANQYQTRSLTASSKARLRNH